jgi:hypothetical protein
MAATGGLPVRAILSRYARLTLCATCRSATSLGCPSGPVQYVHVCWLISEVDSRF